MLYVHGLAVHYVREPFILNPFILQNVRRLVLPVTYQLWVESAAYRLNLLLAAFTIHTVRVGASEMLDWL